MCWANKSMGFVNAGIFDDIEYSVVRAAEGTAHELKVLGKEAVDGTKSAGKTIKPRINGVKFALLLVAGCLDDNVLSEQITF
jgi:hypothetical protein